MVSLGDQLAGLKTMPAAQLRAEWRRHHKGLRMPSGIGRDLASRAIAWRLQERVHGGLPPGTARELKRLIQQLRTNGDLAIAKDVRLKTGTKLVREWHGRIHHVLVLDDGFNFENRHYRSLTPIARNITGAGWSGPRFFGLKGKSSATA